MIYFISDFHFGHARVIEYGERPFSSVDEMNHSMISSYNSVVQPMDTVYIVGDLTLGNVENTKKYLTALNGRKILIRGNHDRGKRDELLDAGYSEIYDTTILDHDGLRIGLSHYPFRPKGEMPGKYDLKPEQCDLLVHGHIHQIYFSKIHESGKLMINVSVEAIDYRPISIVDVIKIQKTMPPSN